MRGCPQFIICSALAVVARSTFGIPLSELILQENEKLTAKVEAWQKQCSDKPDYDESCMKQRYDLCGELGKFVALVNDEVVMLRGPSASNMSAADRQNFDARLRHMEYLIDLAIHRMRCLGRPASDPICKAEATALQKRKSDR